MIKIMFKQFISYFTEILKRIFWGVFSEYLVDAIKLVSSHDADNFSSTEVV